MSRSIATAIRGGKPIVVNTYKDISGRLTNTLGQMTVTHFHLKIRILLKYFLRLTTSTTHALTLDKYKNKSYNI